MNIKHLALVVAVVVLTGCMTPKTSPPIDVAMVPDDCRNRDAIVNWLSQQAAIPQQRMESDENFQRHRRQIRAKIWNMRYVCQPV
jgi:hypothetical protein